MKKIYWVGDVINNTGPAIVNKSYQKYLSNQITFCNSNNKLYRIFHYLINLLSKKIVIISGFSKLNYLFLKIAKMMKKKTFYLMHGCVRVESKYDNLEIVDKVNLEKNFLYSVDNIICVSEKFAIYMKEEFPEVKYKISYVNNGVENNYSKKKITKNEKKYNIISVGGGLKRKNNLAVCEAIKKINNKDIKFIVIGNPSVDGEKIKKYSFVEYYDKLSHDEVINKMKESNLYIQNSYFETFGLAVLEALSVDCDLLLSKEIGAICILENLDENDIINDNENVDEIRKKIENKINNGNNKKISFDKNKCNWKKRSEELIKKMGI